MKGQIYKISATLKDALEHRLKREGYVEGIEMKNGSLNYNSKRKKVAERLDCFFHSYHISCHKTQYSLKQYPKMLFYRQQYFILSGV
jgi:hypothetical protein